MSLDVHLTGETIEEQCWHCEGKGKLIRFNEVYWANITHNLNKMAEEAGIYKHLWRPEEIGITKASQLIEPLRAGLALMKSDPARFENFNSPNGWGLYENFVPWIENYLTACEQNPDADVRVSR